jgi:hypothetical protein
MWRSALIDRTPDAIAFMRVAPNAGPRLWMALSPSLALVTILALFTGWSTPKPHRTWRLAATGLELLVVATTFVYFVPNIIALMGGALPVDVAARKARVWITLNRVRLIFTAIAWAFVLRALMLPI